VTEGEGEYDDGIERGLPGAMPLTDGLGGDDPDNDGLCGAADAAAEGEAVNRSLVEPALLNDGL
jgi:hypothetical protein